jgi:hypothetical protein
LADVKEPPASSGKVRGLTGAGLMGLDTGQTHGEASTEIKETDRNSTRVLLYLLNSFIVIITIITEAYIL